MTAPEPREALRLRNDDAIEAFVERTEAERRALYRAHLRCTVRFASPLLLDLLAAEELALDALVACMEPPPGWAGQLGVLPVRPVIRRLLPRVHKAFRPGARSPDQRFARCLAHGGVVVRPPSHPAGGFGIWTSADMVHAWIDMGEARLAIGGGEAHLWLPQLPDTIASAMPGRDLDRLVTHPLIDRRGYYVRRTRFDPDGSPVLVIGCGVEPIDLTRPGAGRPS